MSLQLLEADLRERRAVIEKAPDGSLLLNCHINDEFAFPVRFTDEQHGLIQANMRFQQRPRNKAIKHPHRLAMKLQARIEPPILFGYDFLNMQFHAWMYIEAEGWWEEVQKLISACYTVHPLVHHAGVTGQWSLELIEFAFRPNSDFYRA